MGRLRWTETIQPIFYFFFLFQTTKCENCFYDGIASFSFWVMNAMHFARLSIFHFFKLKIHVLSTKKKQKNWKSNFLIFRFLDLFLKKIKWKYQNCIFLQMKIWFNLTFSNFQINWFSSKKSKSIDFGLCEI